MQPTREDIREYLSSIEDCEQRAGIAQAIAEAVHPPEPEPEAAQDDLDQQQDS